MAALICALTAPRVALAATTLQCAEPSEPVFASLLDDATSHGVSGSDVVAQGDGIDVNGAPMSLSEGASAVAPRPIDAPSDARIEAAKRCQDDVSNDEAQAPHEDVPLPELASVMAATLADALALPTVGPLERLAPPRLGATPRRGVRRDVERPPQT
jgi:hypothetical protein